VCPWNRKAAASREQAFAPSALLPPPEALLALDEPRFRELFRATPLWRARRAGLLRNAALLLGARRAESARPVLTRALGDASERVRNAAAWALDRLGAS
jgi:epoxyqueuosine reductase